tara:strand:- start:1526 stop:4135 length:2610 start_codon:yes stop_codon:yes gene_type:complete
MDNDVDFYNQPHPSNLYVGDLCLDNRAFGQYEYGNYTDDCPPNCYDTSAYNYPDLDCEWGDCWEGYPMVVQEPWYNYSDTGGLYGEAIPQVNYYQFAPPWGYLPWSPQVMNDWKENWNGPLQPRGDCTMHCNPENIGCHKLAFVGGLGTRWGNHDIGGTVSSVLPFCGSDVATIPPVRGENDEGWVWVKDWVQSGGKLVILSESLNGGGAGCRREHNFREFQDGYLGPADYGDGRRLNWSCMYDDWWELVKDPNDSENQYGLEENYPYSVVEQQLREFAFFCGDDGEGNPEFYSVCNSDTESNEVSRCVEEGYEPVINNIEYDETGEFPKQCCQRTYAPFKKISTVPWPWPWSLLGISGEEYPFSMNTSVAGGLVPKNGGKKLAGSCDSPACTAVYKQNGLGAVIVIYDSSVFGAKATQVPIGWYENAAQHPSNTENLTAEQLKLKDCNNDFWKFLCEEFISTGAEGYECNEGTVFWDEFLKPYNENQCMIDAGTAACCLPDGSCIDTNVWDCFREKGRWQGAERFNPAGIAGSPYDTDMNAGAGQQKFFEGTCNAKCDQLSESCQELDKGSCCLTMYNDSGQWIGYQPLDSTDGSPGECGSEFSDVYDYECTCRTKELGYCRYGPGCGGEGQVLFYTNSCEDWCTTFEPEPPECETNADCPEQNCCVEGECIYCSGDMCETNADCPEQKCCNDGYCVDCGPECLDDDECPDGEICVDGYCVEDDEDEVTTEEPADDGGEEEEICPCGGTFPDCNGPPPGQCGGDDECPYGKCCTNWVDGGFPDCPQSYCQSCACGEAGGDYCPDGGCCNDEAECGPCQQEDELCCAMVIAECIAQGGQDCSCGTCEGMPDCDMCDCYYSNNGYSCYSG